MDEHVEKQAPTSELHELAEGRNRERMVEGELGYCEQRLGNQRRQLDTLVTYREECARGLRSSAHDLTAGQIRDFELLLQHVDEVVESQQQRVQASARAYEQCRAELLEVHEHNQEIDRKIKQMLKHQEQQLELEQPISNQKVPPATRRDSGENKPGKSLDPSYR